MKYDFDRIVNRKGTNSFKWDKLMGRFGRDDIIPMWIADTEFEAPIEVINAIKMRAQHGVYGYTFRSESYYDAIKKWMKKRHGWDIESEWITFSPGIVPALSMCVTTFTQPGDKIITQTPIYPPFYSVIQQNGRILIKNELKLSKGRYIIDFDDLLEKIILKNTYFTSNLTSTKSKFDTSIKMLFLCNPHNPAGRVWTKDELLKIGEICLKNNIIIVSDDIHSDIIYQGNRYSPIASLSKELEDISITCISPGKTFSLTGMATSAIIIPNEKLREEFTRTLETLELDGGNIFGAVATEAAYKYGEDWLEHLLDYLESNLNFLMDYFQSNIPQIKPIKPEGTYLVWLDCSKLGLEGIELMDFFVNEAKLGVNPGSSFGVNSKQFVRMNIACSRKILQEALMRLKLAIESRYLHKEKE